MSLDYGELIKNTLLSAYIRENVNIEEKKKKIDDILIEGANVNFKDANDKQNTALHIAVSLEEIEIVDLLLNRGAQILIRNTEGKTALDLAKKLNSDLGKEIMALLLARLVIEEKLKAENQGVTGNDQTIKTVCVNDKQPSYIKRSGTSGVTGQLYETKILSLVMLKASTDPDIEQFYLGTNISGIGAFDDLCFRYKMKNYEKDILVSLQAKHRDDPETRRLTINDIRSIAGDFGLPKYLDSYLKIKTRFNSKNDDPMFAGDFSNVECNFILYTPSKDMLDDSLKIFKEQSPKVKELLSTHTVSIFENNNNDTCIFQYNYNIVDVDFLSKFMVKDKIKCLGVTLMDFVINNAKFSNMLTNDLLKTYHVVLAQKVIDVSCIAPSGMFRNGKFRPDFFYSTEEYVTVLRESCFRELVTTHAKTLKLRKKDTKKLLQQMVSSPSGDTLSKLLGTVLIHNEKSNKLELNEENMKSFKHDDVKLFKEYLKDIQFNESILNNAIETICNEELKNKEFKLPNSFGNFDMTIRSGTKKENKDDKKDIGSKKGKLQKDDNSKNCAVNNETQNNEGKLAQETQNETKDQKSNKDKFNQRLDHLVSKFEVLFKRFQKTKVIVIDDNIVGPKKLLEEGFLDINGGIGGAVGNLLIMNNLTGLFQLNTNTTGDTANKLLEKLKQVLPDKEERHTIITKDLNTDNENVSKEGNLKPSKEDITSYSLNIKTTGFPKLSFYVTDDDKQVTQDFLNRLWFYTNQAKEDKVESILKTEIDKRYNACRGDNLFRIHSDAIFLRFHDEIQKWWMLSGQVNYLTNERNIFDEINKFVVENPLLTILNAMYLNKINKIGIEYSKESVKNLQIDTFNEKIINVVTEANTLSGIKISQYFKHDNHAFIDFDYVLRLPKNDFDKMIDELHLTKIKTLIVVYEILKAEDSIDEKLVHIISDFKELEGRRIIIVTNKILAVQIKILYSNECVTLKDELINLNNLTNKSQTKILQEAKIHFQSEEVNLYTVIGNDTKHLVNPNILWKVINNERLDIGRKTKLTTYNDYKEIEYCKRTLQLDDNTIEVETLNDLEENVVVLTARPGMGKTTLLLHLASQTKQACPYIWIPLINFYNCTDVFSKWQENKLDINFKDIFNLFCALMLKNNVEFTFDLEKEDEKFKISNYGEIDPVILFELEVFLDFYNKRKIMFLFDDFDDICPPYEKEAMALLNTIEADGNKLWITSRSYPGPTMVLEREFGQCYSLMPIDRPGQTGFFRRFFRTNLKLEHLNNEQFSNVSAFLKFISKDKEFQQIARHLIPLISIPVHLMYIIFVDLFENEINYLNSSKIRKTLKKRLDFDIGKWGMLSSLGSDTSSEIEEVEELAGTPLYMYIAANYFELQVNESVNVKVDESGIKEMLNIGTNAVKLYKQFLEKTLKGVCFNKANIDENVEEEEQVKLREEFFEKHKKLALLAICKEEDLYKLLKPEEIDELKETIEQIRTGEIRTGSMEFVLNDVPRFYHLMFAEYFIVEVLLETLKAVSQGEMIDFKRQKAIWDFILNIFLYQCPQSVRNVFDYKLKHDPELQEMTCKDYCREIVFELLLKQNVVYHNEASTSTGPSRFSLNVVIADGLTCLTEFLIKCIHDNLTKRNVAQFVDLMRQSELVNSCIRPEHKIFVDMICNIVKDVDADKVLDIVNSPSFVEVPARLAELTGDERLVETVRTQLTTVRQQLNSDSGELFGINRDTANLIRGVFMAYKNMRR